MAQNISHAVMAQRTEAKDSLDDFPTPPWATRALLSHAIPWHLAISQHSCLEPAANRGYMSKVLGEFFGNVQSSDVHDYGNGGTVRDFLKEPYPDNSFDWVITNPPFRLAEDFVLRSLKVARVGVAMLVRTMFVESSGRYKNLFTPHPPYRVAQFVERVPMVKGRLDKKASTATGYCWMIWLHSHEGPTELFWIPPTRKSLENITDYPLPRLEDNHAPSP